MHEMGCSLSSREGDVGDMYQMNLLLPPRIGRHRPDAAGRLADGRLCIGEAKTAEDIYSARTREQLEDYLKPADDDYPLIFVGFPSGSEERVHALLRSLGAIDCPQLVLISVPDELLDA
jgi:hypothetical protein